MRLDFSLGVLFAAVFYALLNHAYTAGQADMAHRVLTELRLMQDGCHDSKAP